MDDLVETGFVHHMPHEALKVSVIMPAYNAAKYIGEAIRSIIKQTYDNWELIVVDDGSTDDTARIVNSLMADEPRISYIYQENNKLGAARNTGLKKAEGDWIGFLDSDDVWLPEKLDKQVASIRELQCDVLFTQGFIFQNSSCDIGNYDCPVGFFTGKDMLFQLFENNTIPILSALVRNEFLQSVGFQDESPEAFGCEDWDYWLRCALNDARFFGMADRTFRYRINSGGMSSDNLKMHMSGCYVMFKNYRADSFTLEKRRLIEMKLIDKVHHIVNELFKTRQAKSISRFLQYLTKLTLFHIKTGWAIFFVHLLGIRSSRIVNHLLSNG